MNTDKSKPENLTVDEMRAAISAMTGRPCVSKDAAHLRRRLADLRKNQDAGKAAQDATTVMSVSMHGKAKSAAKRIAESEGLGVSELIRNALAEWAANNGHKSEVDNFIAEEG